MSLSPAESQFVPRGRAQPPGVLIVDDLCCPGCGYSLKGLKAGGPCPECGRTIAYGSRSGHHDHLGDAPRGFLARLTLGLMLLAGGGVAQIVVFMSNGLPDGLFGLAVSFAAAASWLTGVIVVVLPRPAEMAPDGTTHRPMEWTRLRLVAVASQGAWLGVPIAGYLESLAPGQGLRVAALILVVVGVTGWPVVALLLSFIADWAMDDKLATHLRTAAWGMAAGGMACLAIGLLAQINHPWAVFPLVFSGLTTFILLLSYGVMLVTSLRMVSMVNWAISNSRDAAERDQRIAECRGRYWAEVESRREEIPEPPAEPMPGVPIRAAADSSRDADEGMPRPGSSTPCLKPKEGVEAYPLEEEP